MSTINDYLKFAVRNANDEINSLTEAEQVDGLNSGLIHIEEIRLPSVAVQMAALELSRVNIYNIHKPSHKVIVEGLKGCTYFLKEVVDPTDDMYKAVPINKSVLLFYRRLPEWKQLEIVRDKFPNLFHLIDPTPLVQIEALNLAEKSVNFAEIAHMFLVRVKCPCSEVVDRLLNYHGDLIEFLKNVTSGHIITSLLSSGKPIRNAKMINDLNDNDKFIVLDYDVNYYMKIVSPSIWLRCKVLLELPPTVSIWVYVEDFSDNEFYKIIKKNPYAICYRESPTIEQIEHVIDLRLRLDLKRQIFRLKKDDAYRLTKKLLAMSDAL